MPEVQVTRELTDVEGSEDAKVRIIEQAMNNLPEGRVAIDDRRISLPPIGEVYSYWEAANGELGFYLASDGGKNPYRLHCRGSCFYIFQAFSHMVKGCYVSDAVAALGSLNIVAGELEK